MPAQLKRNLSPSDAKSMCAKLTNSWVCVRYRSDEQRGKRFKTIELILEETSWQPPVRPFQDDEIVLIRIEFSETHWRDRVKAAGGKWNPNLKLWEITYGQVRKLGLTDRIHSLKVSDNGKSKTSVRGK